MSQDKIVIKFPTATILFTVFLTLKLTDNIDWSWWWVTAPIWIPLTLIVVFVLLRAMSR